MNSEIFFIATIIYSNYHVKQFCLMVVHVINDLKLFACAFLRCQVAQINYSIIRHNSTLNIIKSFLAHFYFTHVKCPSNRSFHKELTIRLIASESDLLCANFTATYKMKKKKVEKYFYFTFLLRI